MAATKKVQKAEAAEARGLAQVGGSVPNPVRDAGGGTAVGVRAGTPNHPHDNTTRGYTNATTPAIDGSGHAFGVRSGALNHPHDS